MDCRPPSADMNQAMGWLAKADSPELKLHIRGYVEPSDHAEGTSQDAHAPKSIALDAICDHVVRALRGTNNLMFGGSRGTEASAADRLRLRCEKAGVPNEFYPHHGSLSKVLREDLEIRLKDSSLRRRRSARRRSSRSGHRLGEIRRPDRRFATKANFMSLPSRSMLRPYLVCHCFRSVQPRPWTTNCLARRLC
ncbi:hypothetical protein ACVWZ6_000068 [Bradyrhizobium sp. GM6.1]